MSKTGVICKVEKNRYFILTDSGDFLMRSGQPPAGKGLGDRINYGTSSINRAKRLAVVAAALVLIAVSSLQFLPWQSKAVQYRMSLDINPSLELVYDQDYRLLEWHAHNLRGENLINAVEMPEDLYSALALIFSQCVDGEFVQDEQDIFVTAVAESPLDEDRLLGAFEGHGAAVRLHVVRLAMAEYKYETGSPLRGYLNRKAGTELEESEPVAEAALGYLSSELVSSVEIVPWHNNPVIQAFVEKYLVSGRQVAEMLDDGLTPDDIAGLLDLAKAGKLSPADIYKQFKSSGMTPGQFLKEQNQKPEHAKVPNLSDPEWVLEILAMEFGHSPGQISSYLRKGMESPDLQALLILESLGAGKVQKLIKAYEQNGLDALLASVDGGEYDRELHRLQVLMGRAEDADFEAAENLAGEYKLSKADVIYILARGYSLKDAKGILESKHPGRTIKQVLDEMENPDEGKKPGKPNNPGKPDNPGKP